MGSSFAVLLGKKQTVHGCLNYGNHKNKILISRRKTTKHYCFLYSKYPRINSSSVSTVLYVPHSIKRFRSASDRRPAREASPQCARLALPVCSRPTQAEEAKARLATASSLLTTIVEKEIHFSMLLRAHLHLLI